MLEALPIQFERRLKTPPRWLAFSMPIFSGVLALIVAAVVLLISGQDAISVYKSMFESAFTRSGALSASLVSASPLLFTGLAAALAFRMKVWNIGGEGQLYIGAICASAAGLLLGGSGPAVAVLGMAVAGALGGALWAAIPGLLRSYLKTNEILTSLMLNYVAGLVMYYLIFDSSSYWRDLSSPEGKVFPVAKQLSPAAWWGGVTRGSVVVPVGIVIGIVIAIWLYVLITRTRFGFHLRVVADSPAAGRYAGIRTRWMLVVVMLLSGALAGIGGASQVGFSHLLDPAGLEQAQYGYTGIVAAALARYNPLAVVPAAIFLGAITNAGYDVQSGVSQGLIGVIEGIILFCVLGGDLLIRYRFRLGQRRDPREKAVSGEAEPAASIPSATPAPRGTR
jgi:simple sugar transport system permease protein